TQSETPTHLLVGANAWPLAQTSMFLQSDAVAPITTKATNRSLAQLEWHSNTLHLLPTTGAAIELNGRELLDNTELRNGDNIRLAQLGDSLRLIRVLGAYGS